MSIQQPNKVGIQTSAVDIGTRPTINYVPGTNISFSAVDNPTDNRVDVTINASSPITGVGSAGQITRWSSATALTGSSVLLDDTGASGGFSTTLLFIQTANRNITFQNATGTLAFLTDIPAAITALTGDVTATGPGSVAATLATVNANVGSFGSSTSIPTFTVNAKGLITAASGNVVIAPAGTLTGTTLNSTVVTSSLTSVGTITSGTWTGTTIAVANGGTSLTTLTANNLIVGAGTSAVTFIAPGTSGNVLTSNGTVWASATPTTPAPTTAQYVTLATDATLTQERVLTGTANQIVITDNGAGSTVVLSTPQNINTGASPTFSGLTLSSLSVAGIVHNSAAGVLSTSLIVNADVSASAAIAFSKLATLNTGNVIFGVSNVATSTALNTIAVTALSGTANQITASASVGSVTLSFPSLLKTVNVEDATFTIKDDVDNTKIVAFQASGITTGTTRTFTFPDATGTLALLSTVAPIGAQYVTLATDATLTNERVLTAGTAISITDAGAGSTVTIANTGVTALAGTANQITASAATGSVTLSFPSLLKTVNVEDATFTIKDDADNTKIAAFQASGITTGTTRTFTFPDATGTLALTSTAAPIGSAYLTIGVDATLTNERSFAVNATNLTFIDLGGNNAYTINTIQDIATSSTPTFQRLLLTGSTNQNFINAAGTLDGTLAEIAYTLAWTTNKASGNDTGLLLSMTDSASPGVSLPLDIQVGGVSKLSVDNAGLLTSVNHTITALSAVGVVLNSAAGVLSTLAPGTSGNVLTSNGSAWVSSPSAGGGMSIGGTVTSGTAGSILFVNAGPILAQDNSHLFWDDTNNRLGVNTASPTAAVNITSAIGEKLLTVTAPAFSTAASTEFTSVTFDLSATHTFTSGPLTTQRGLRIISPTYNMSGIDTLTTAATLSVEGPPAAGGGINITNSYGLWIPTRAVTAGVQFAIGAVVAAPTGAFGSNIGMVVDGKFGMGTYSPASFFDIQPTAFDSSMNHLCIDGTTRYSAGYFGGTQYAVVPSSGAALMIYDTGVNYLANTSFAQRSFQSLFTLDGGFNYTGGITNFNALTTVRTTAGTATAVTSNNAGITTSGVANITTARNYQTAATYAGTGTVTTAVNYDTANTISGSTVTDLIGFRFGLPTVSSGTLTTVTAIDILDQTETATNKIGVRQRGTNTHNRFNGDTSFAQDSLPGAAIDMAGKLFITNSGLVTKYDNLVTVGRGIPYQVATQDLTAQVAAKAATTIFTPTQTGWFRINIYLQVTTAATTSSILGGATGVVITYNDGDGNVAQTRTAALQTNAGAIAVTSATNTTGTSLEGEMVIYARTGVAIQYAIGYTSVGATAMQYAAHLRVEAM